MIAELIYSILWRKSKQMLYEGMKELIKGSFFPHDRNTLWIIREMEVLLGLESKDIDKMNYNELIEYINQLALMSLKY